MVKETSKIWKPDWKEEMFYVKEAMGWLEIQIQANYGIFCRIR